MTAASAARPQYKTKSAQQLGALDPGAVCYAVDGSQYDSDAPLTPAVHKALARISKPSFWALPVAALRKSPEGRRLFRGAKP